MVIRSLSVKVPSNKTLADGNIGFCYTCDASRPAAVGNVLWHWCAVYLDAVIIGLQGRHLTIQAFEHFVFITLRCC